MARTVAVLLVAASAVASLGARQAQSPPAFDVVSIKPNPFAGASFAGFAAGMGPCGGATFTTTGPRVSFGTLTVCSLIRMAYEVKDYQILSIPPRMDGREPSSWFAVEARGAAGQSLTIEQTRLMLQTMLADRFKLKFHREPRRVPVYAMVVPKEGHKLKPGTAGKPCELLGTYRPMFGTLKSCEMGTTMARLVWVLNRELDRPVVDRTNLDGTFALSLEWAASEPLNGGDGRPSLFTAVQEQLGLRLERSTDAVDAIIVDSVEPPSPN